jgi:hypothetical protein
MKVRWNSSAKMLRTSFPYKDVFGNFYGTETEVPEADEVEDEEGSSKPAKKAPLGRITLPEWELMVAIYRFLKPFEEYTIALSASKTVTISQVVPVHLEINAQFQMISNNPFEFDEVIVACAAEMMTIMDKYDLKKLNPIYQVAHVLDPRFKLMFLEAKDPDGAEEARGVIAEIFRQHYAPEQQDEDRM